MFRYPEGLTIKGLPGAALAQPATDPATGPVLVLSIVGSRNVTVSGLAIHTRPGSNASGIGVGKGSTGIELRNLAIDGPWGIQVYGNSQALIAKVNVSITGGYAAISAFDKSDVHIQDCAIQPSGSGWFAGIFISTGHVTMQGTTIRDMQQSINVDDTGSLDLIYYDTSTPNSDVVVDNPGNGNFTGVSLRNSSSLNVDSARLLINHAGQIWGGSTAAVMVTNNSTVNAGPNLVITNSYGQGLLVTNNSHATLAGSSITGSAHGGLVVLNLSTATFGGDGALTLTGANTPDLFCDSKSLISGLINAAGVPTSACSNTLQYDFENMP
ncbi:MAG TPA: right-handed parallel beta-helix repeat-containing protein [Terriglobales bacterium]|nr:right-handed parallel beta-helix repeat-containing protein [Terriglobales bacterium]